MVHAAMWRNIRRNEAHTGDDMPNKHSTPKPANQQPLFNPDLEPFEFHVSQKQIAQALNLKVATISARITKIRSEVGGDPLVGHEKVLEYQASSGVHQVYFYDLYAIFKITSRMSHKKERTRAVFFALLDFISAVIAERDNTLELAEKAISVFQETPDVNSGKAGIVYLFLNEGGVYKIGMTIDLHQRWKHLEREHGPLELIAFIETVDRYKLEKDLHQHYAAKHSHLEWFNLSQNDVEEFIRMAVQS
jgi:hypothetical protein